MDYQSLYILLRLSLSELPKLMFAYSESVVWLRVLVYVLYLFVLSTSLNEWLAIMISILQKKSL